MLRKQTAWLLFTLLAVIFLVTLVMPVGIVIYGGFVEEGQFTLRYLSDVFRNPIYAEGLLNSFAIAFGTTTLASLLSLPLAWLASRYNFTGKGFLGALVLVPLILPPFVGAIGMTQILGPYGALNALLGLGPIDWLGQSRYAGVIILQALALYPIIFLNVSAALANVDPAMEEAAANMGASGWIAFRRITLPLILPGLFAGSTLVFIASFTELGTPLMLNYTRCAAVQVYDALKEVSSSPFPYALVTVVLGTSVILYSISRALFGRRAHAMTAKASVSRQTINLRGWRATLPALAFIIVATLALLPHLGVILTSFSVPGTWYRSLIPAAFTTANYTEALSHGMTIDAIRNSLLFSSMAVIFNLALGIAVAWIVVRSTLPLRGLLDTAAMIPLAVPGLVMAFGYLALSIKLSNMGWFHARPAWATLIDVRENPTLFLVIAYGVRRLPFMVRAAVAGLQQTSVTLEEAAANLGAPPLKIVRRITAPLIAANLIAGILLAFAFSMLEVSDSLILAQKIDYYPITKTIFELFQLIGAGRYLASALGVWAMSFLGVAIIGTSLLLGKKMGALFRI
ncbi:MAG: iron ABC transporter permease [Lentisphaerae bacterium]|jgi:iron(III) transport system permease protein|nr:iron ABC transporter permease [Lentisphaerota bacterium]